MPSPSYPGGQGEQSAPFDGAGRSAHVESGWQGPPPPAPSWHASTSRHTDPRGDPDGSHPSAHPATTLRFPWSLIATPSSPPSSGGGAMTSGVSDASTPPPAMATSTLCPSAAITTPIFPLDTEASSAAAEAPASSMKTVAPTRAICDMPSGPGGPTASTVTCEESIASALPTDRRKAARTSARPAPCPSIRSETPRCALPTGGGDAGGDGGGGAPYTSCHVGISTRSIHSTDKRPRETTALSRAPLATSSWTRREVSIPSSFPSTATRTGSTAWGVPGASCPAACRRRPAPEGWEGETAVEGAAGPADTAPRGAPMRAASAEANVPSWDGVSLTAAPP
mmetsp:Transcript_46322/g.148320  ORF Transcript_46322/g.148320 Transcript_46322/m.148320 type:complete len:339 (-) Transcript_46322:45-1061(-)